MTAGSFDAELVRRHLRALDEAVAQLRRHSDKPVQAFEGNLDLRWTVQHGLQLCAQNVLDIATHLAASAGHDTPDYATAIDLLGRMGVLPADFARQLRGLAGFRNILVHGYLAVDLGRVHQLLSQRLGDFEVFAQHVDAWMRESER